MADDSYSIGAVGLSEDTATGAILNNKSTNQAGHKYDATLRSGEDETNNVIVVEEGQFSYSHITTATTTDLSQNAGAFLHSITINGGTAGAVTVYDDTTSDTTTPIAVIAAAAAATPAGTKTYNVALTNGLQIATAADTDVTVSYRPSSLD